MYKVLLVDDEALTREAIGENIPWGELGFELVESCENGGTPWRPSVRESRIWC